ncbi:hypothetical protein TRIUR3_28819 [Triticum urartu]|uniref:Uncharacterized protein n=1 Tax=Triticum urartu TaxID=4572 RepID=M7YP65_TRIUA|nr:hypothetical protein TRIUR3_28819 [Triticum urartu]
MEEGRSGRGGRSRQQRRKPAEGRIPVTPAVSWWLSRDGRIPAMGGWVGGGCAAAESRRQRGGLAAGSRRRGSGFVAGSRRRGRWVGGGRRLAVGWILAAGRWDGGVWDGRWKRWGARTVGALFFFFATVREFGNT